MRKALIAVLVIASGVSVAGTVMSQGIPLEDAKRGLRAANPDDSRERQSRNEVANILQQAKEKLRRLNAPAPRDLELMMAMNVYILDNQFDAVINHLEQIIAASPDTTAATRAQKAIQVLRGEEPTTTGTPSSDTSVPQQRKKSIERDAEDRQRPATRADDHDKQ